MSTLTEHETKFGLLTYATTKGSHLHMAARHVVSYLELPEHEMIVHTTGTDHRLAFYNSTDCDAAKLVLDDVLAD